LPGDNFPAVEWFQTNLARVSSLSIEIVPFSRQVSRDDFWCGNEVLDNWLKQFAGQNEDRFRSRTFFAIDLESNQLLGYYTAVFTSLDGGVQLEGLPVSNYKRPAYLIARLAVDQRFQNLGVGKFLLSDALTKAIQASDVAGLEMVLVDAKDNSAITFYGRFGFTRLDAQSRRMYATIRLLQNS
jgi:GNAT superfamily N-acetyltransferase